MVKLEKLSCNSCGAPLEVPETAKFVTCNHCSTRLAVRRTETATFTEQLENLEAGQDQLRERLEKVELENQLAELERDWEREKAQFLSEEKHGVKRLPANADVTGWVVVAVMGILLTVALGSSDSSAAICGVFAAAIGVCKAAFLRSKMRDYNAALDRYQRRRHKLLNGDRPEWPPAGVEFGRNDSTAEGLQRRPK